MENILGTSLANRYLIEDLAGVGGMCNVYRAFDSEELRTVAVKLLRDEYTGDEEYLRRFRNESKAINALSHPNIVKIYDVVLDVPNPYLVMEYVDGITLKEYIEQRKPIAGRSAANIVGLILTALQCAHESGIVHRDVKPQNIMVTRDGQVKVMDFGIARFAMSQNHTVDGNAIGSVHYISPEQALGGAVDQRTDIYSVGVILFEMLSGKLPFEGESPISVALQQVKEAPRTLRSIKADIPLGLEQITARAMAKDPEDRYPDCNAMITDLRKWIADPKATFPWTPRHTAPEAAPAKTGTARKAKDKPGLAAMLPHGGKKQKNAEPKPKEKGKGSPMTVLLAVTGGVIVASILFVFVMFKIYDPFATVADMKMPDLVGVDYTTAIGGAYSDLKIELESEDFNTDYEEGQIYYQNPAAGRTVKCGSTVRVKVSAGSLMIPLPSFVNQEATAVYAKLASLGLNYSISSVASDTVAEGSVVRTSPEAGQSVEAGSTVVVYLSSGSDKPKVTVPDALNFPEDYARTMLEAAGFVVEVTYQTTDWSKVGQVIRQSPASPSQVPEGSRITLTIGTDDLTATGEATVTLQTTPPGLTGTVTVTAVMNGETVYSNTMEPANTRLISIPLKGTGSNAMVDILVDGSVFKSAMVDFSTGQYYWTADYSAGFTE